ncbi:hypothetical protein L596_025130 [Steinernema carpocapsae]|uniref:Uncharacterized protein n=1 Tax=Steinernema carpocapsae TaxID=34508 RepID=A0A4U5M7R2_STECR|nr:hypothetical protein L596_025130 [Steinernema carpocapsae]
MGFWASSLNSSLLNSVLHDHSANLKSEGSELAFSPQAHNDSTDSKSLSDQLPSRAFSSADDSETLTTFEVSMSDLSVTSGTPSTVDMSTSDFSVTQSEFSLTGTTLSSSVLSGEFSVTTTSAELSGSSGSDFSLERHLQATSSPVEKKQIVKKYFE